MDKQNGLRIPRKLQRIVSMLTAVLMVISTLATDGGVVLVNATTVSDAVVVFSVTTSEAGLNLEGKNISYTLKHGDDEVSNGTTPYDETNGQSFTANVDDSWEYTLDVSVVDGTNTYKGSGTATYDSGENMLDFSSISLVKMQTKFNVEVSGDHITYSYAIKPDSGDPSFTQISGNVDLDLGKEYILKAIPDANYAITLLDGFSEKSDGSWTKEIDATGATMDDINVTGETAGTYNIVIAGGDITDVKIGNESVTSKNGLLLTETAPTISVKAAAGHRLGETPSEHVTDISSDDTTWSGKISLDGISAGETITLTFGTIKYYALTDNVGNAIIVKQGTETVSDRTKLLAGTTYTLSYSQEEKFEIRNGSNIIGNVEYDSNTKKWNWSYELTYDATENTYSITKTDIAYVEFTYNTDIFDSVTVNPDHGSLANGATRLYIDETYSLSYSTKSNLIFLDAMLTVDNGSSYSSIRNVATPSITGLTVNQNVKLEGSAVELDNSKQLIDPITAMDGATYIVCPSQTYTLTEISDLIKTVYGIKLNGDSIAETDFSWEMNDTSHVTTLSDNDLSISAAAAEDSPFSVDLMYGGESRKTYNLKVKEFDLVPGTDYRIINKSGSEAYSTVVPKEGEDNTFYFKANTYDVEIIYNTGSYNRYIIQETPIVGSETWNSYSSNVLIDDKNWEDIYLRLSSNDINKVSKIGTAHLIADSTAPVVENIVGNGDDSSDWTTSRTIEFDVSDTGSGVSQVYISTENYTTDAALFTAIDNNNSDLKAVALNSGQGTFTVNDDEEYTSKPYYIYALDAVGNYSKTERLVYKIDNLSPRVTIVYNLDGDKKLTESDESDGNYYINKANEGAIIETIEIKDLTFKAEDFINGFGDNIKLELIETEGIRYKYSVSLKDGIDDGTYSIPANDDLKALFKDAIHDMGSYTDDNTGISKVVLDTVAPSFDNDQGESTIIVRDNYKYQENGIAFEDIDNTGFCEKVKVSFELKDANLSTNSVMIYIGENVIAPSTSSTSNPYIYESADITKDSGCYTIRIVASDKAGNSVEKESGKFILDNSAAEISDVKIAKEDGSDEIKLNNSMAYFKSDKYLFFTVTEDNFDMEHVIVKVNDTEYTRVGTVTDGSNTNNKIIKVPLRSIISTYDGETDYAIQIIYDDIPYGESTGRDAQTEVFKIRVDDTAPSLTGTVRESGKVPKAIVDLALIEANPQDKNVLKDIAITAVDVNGEDISTSISASVGDEGNTQVSGVNALADALKAVGNWTYKIENGKSVYRTTIEISTDGIYTFEASSTDKSVNKGNTYATGEFVVDHTVPTIDSVEITEAKNFLDYKYFSGSTVNVKVAVSDATSGINKNAISLSTKDVNGVEKTYSGTVVEADSKVADKTGRYPKVVVTIPIPKDEADFKGQLVTVHVEDMVANITESGSYGVIVETKDMHMATSSLDITPSAYNKNDFYNKDVTLSMSAEDTYSGLKIVNYTLNGNKTKALDNTGSTAAIQTSKWSDAIVLSATPANEGNEIKVGLDIEDNAGNTSEIEKTYKIDITKPVVTVTYDLNSPSNEKYYNQTRTATITIDELNLDTATAVGDVQLIVTRNGSPVAVTNNFSRTGNVSTMTYAFAEDGDYTFTVSAEDMAGNKADYTQVDEFTIDQTLPAISIAYDNNNANNGNYYGEGRTATVTVEEHNFDPNGVAMTITATNDGAAATVPTISSFTSNGDVHTASIQFNEDADYTITGTVTDLASNESQALAQEEFIVDLIAPEVTISAVEEGASYNGTISPRVTVTDTNFDENGVTIEVSGGKNGVNHDVSYTGAAITNGEEYTYVDFARKESNDDYYTMTAIATDKAGHQTTQFTTFRVNRFGSVYDLNTYTQNAVDNFYTNAEEDFVIIETNVDELESVDIFYSKDGEIVDLTEGVDYNTEMKENSSNWREYTYTIDSDRITDEGVYVFSVYSEDVAGNKTDNKSKGKDIEFCIDRTAPSVVITGVADGEVYEEESVTATIDVYDNIYLSSVEVYLNGDMTEYKSEDIQDGKIEIIIPESNRDQTLRVRGIDGAGNVFDTDDNGPIQFTVSTSWVVVNSRWIWFAIGGAVLLLAGGFIIFLLKRRKSQNQ